MEPFDKFIQDDLVYNENQGLKADYPWITKEWVDNQVKSIIKSDLVPGRLYYNFFEIKFIKSSMRNADGSEIEDGMYWLNCCLFSQNALIAKLLELKAKQHETERYINTLLGLQKDEKPEEKKEEKPKPWWQKINIKSGGWLTFSKSGPYETNMNDRIAADFRRIGQYRFNPVVSLMKERFGFGQV